MLVGVSNSGSLGVSGSFLVVEVLPPSWSLIKLRFNGVYYTHDFVSFSTCTTTPRHFALRALEDPGYQHLVSKSQVWAITGDYIDIVTARQPNPL